MGDLRYDSTDAAMVMTRSLLLKMKKLVLVLNPERNVVKRDINNHKSQWN